MQDKIRKKIENFGVPSCVSLVMSIRARPKFWINWERLMCKQARLVESLSKLALHSFQESILKVILPKWITGFRSIYSFRGFWSLIHPAMSLLQIWDQEAHRCAILPSLLSISCMGWNHKPLSLSNFWNRKNARLLLLWIR